MIEKALLLGAPLLLLGGMATAAQQPQDSEKAERRICRSELKTGSLVGRRRVCRTESEWREIRSHDRDGVDVFKNRPNAPCTYGGSTSCQ